MDLMLCSVLFGTLHLYPIMANNPQYSGLQPLRPPVVSPMDQARSFVPPMTAQQFRPAVPAPHSQQFVPLPSPHFQPLGQGVPLMNVGMPPPPQAQQSQFSQPVAHLPPRPCEPVHGTLPPQTIQLPVAQPNRPFTPELQQAQPLTQSAAIGMPGPGGSGTSLSASYSYGPPQNYNTTIVHPVPQSHAPVVSSGGQLGSLVAVTPLNHSREQPYATSSVTSAANVLPMPSGAASSGWREHTSAGGRRYYYNKTTKISSWEKPFELMTSIERADASTNWKEFTSPEGRKYYYNKITKESKWIIPEELKLARERVEKSSTLGTEKEPVPLELPSVSTLEAPSTTADTAATAKGLASSTVSVTAADLQTDKDASPGAVSSVETNGGVQSPVNIVPSSCAISENDNTAGVVEDTTVEPRFDLNQPYAQDTENLTDGVSAQELEETKKDIAEEKVEFTLEERAIDQETSAYPNKQEAKNAFKALLESANVGSDWTWDRAMRIIINDKRYGALKTLGERKQAFNEFLGQRKKQEVDERRIKQKKAREEFRKMLEESTELTSSMRWGKVESIFENDERFQAVERDRDRRDLFDSFLEELKTKERAKAQEERSRNILDYRKFLESCDFIKASSQWRKVQDRLEVDERCSRLEKIDRLEIFQEYLRDLEKEEEEQRKIQKEELRKAERKNRDEFRKMMEEHIAAGILTPKIHWRDYCMKVKELPAYLAVAANTSGSTPKDLFEDVAEELQKQYRDDKTRIKDAVKLRKIAMSLSWTLDDFKAAISKDIGNPAIPDINLKLVFDELLERAREKEEKEAKKRKRLGDDFFNLLCSFKEISAYSNWEDCRRLFEGSQEYSAVEDESLCKEIFEEYIEQLKEHAKENENKRKEEKARKGKEREERERRKERHRKGEREKEDHFKKDGVDNENVDVLDTLESKENRRLEKERSKKQRKRRYSDEEYSDEDETGYDRSKKSQSHKDRKKSRRHGSAHESDGESRHRRHKKDHRNGSYKNFDHEELEDGECGDDGASRNSLEIPHTKLCSQPLNNLLGSGNEGTTDFWHDSWACNMDRPLALCSPLFSVSYKKVSMVKDLWLEELAFWELDFRIFLKDEDVSELAELSLLLSNVCF
ncbi:pre-mRNA-processing protein 40A-like isoform X7 [Benincasa hispida]|uniref:pre-mRNA-processing protein 40A-like isoform X7 n=1 Tax=Benincasa hispida TaxID=102211 RepID=UPI001901F634|nr:pre-mRNA-processing protein 40A-like isoform X7 [Benincasa hispida]